MEITRGGAESATPGKVSLPTSKALKRHVLVSLNAHLGDSQDLPAKVMLGKAELQVLTKTDTLPGIYFQG